MLKKIMLAILFVFLFIGAIRAVTNPDTPFSIKAALTELQALQDVPNPATELQNYLVMLNVNYQESTGLDAVVAILRYLTVPFQFIIYLVKDSIQIIRTFVYVLFHIVGLRS